MPRTLILAAALVMLSAGLARAQVNDITTGLPDYGSNYFYLTPSYERPITAEDMRRDNLIEQKYRETLRTKIPDKKPSNDPWRNVRPAATAAAYDRHRPQ
jgi:hypothetical protein